jgi:transcriptional regulator with XRE-family HTH domain
MESENRIGEFLRARREQVRPEEVGIPELGGRRRVPGLRREELAMLAGVSADYYVRLETGRDQHPSEQVLDALARALRLDDDAAVHLHELARPAQRRRRPRARAERVRPGVLRLLEAWPQTPAYVTGRRMDVLAVNALATVLNPAFAPGNNLVRWAFFHEATARALYPDFETIAANTVAWLRATVGPDLDDPQLIELIGELSLKSELFRHLWARHDVLEKSDGNARVTHPLVGPLELRYEIFSVSGADGQVLTVLHAEPDSASERCLALLSSIVAERRAGTAPNNQAVANPTDSTFRPSA